MEKVSVSSKTLIKSSMDSLSMVNFKDKASCTFQLGIIMLVISSMIKSKEGECTDGLGSSRMCIRVSLSQVREMVGEHSGGPMAAGTRVSSKTVFNAVLAHFTVKAALVNTRAFGKTACSTARASNISTTVNAIKAISKRINSMAMASSTKTTQSSTVCGRIMNYP